MEWLGEFRIAGQNLRMKIGSYEVLLIHEGTMMADGGPVFGPIPKNRWRLRIPPNEHNRIPLGIHAILVKAPDFNLLIDTGAGNKNDERNRNMYGFEITETVFEKLPKYGVSPDEVSHIVFTHLHTDHAGGATSFSADRSEVVPNYPQAKIFVQGGEWRHALSPHELSRVSYQIEDFLPLWSEAKIEFLRGDREILPGIRLEVSGGHTLFHQMVRISSGKDEIVYPGDVIPTSFHVPITWRSAVDLYPIDSMDMKRKLLDSVINTEKILAFSHDPVGGFWNIKGTRDNPIVEQIEA